MPPLLPLLLLLAVPTLLGPEDPTTLLLLRAQA
jgi:hypothetical protein